MLFHNEPIFVGDAVYDMYFQAGVVVFVCDSTQRIQVNFGGRTYAFSPDGRRNAGAGQTLYWHEPVGTLVPMKDINKWKFCRKIRDLVMQMFFNWFGWEEKKDA